MLLPSSYLNITLIDVQLSLFNPTMNDVFLSTAEANAFGTEAMKKHTSCRMDIIDSNAKNCSKWLND